MPESLARRRRFALDPRLLIGLLLVVGSVVGVVGIVSAADSRTLVYAAAGPLAPGDRIDGGDLVERSVALDGTDTLYLAPDDLPDGGLVVTQSVRDGELVPLSAVGSVAGLRTHRRRDRVDRPAQLGRRPGKRSGCLGGSGGRADRAGGPVRASLRAGSRTRSWCACSRMTGWSHPAASPSRCSFRGRGWRACCTSIANADALAIVPSGLPWEG